MFIEKWLKESNSIYIAPKCITTRFLVLVQAFKKGLISFMNPNSFLSTNDVLIKRL